MNTSISPLQLTIIYINSAIGAGMLTLPRSVAEAAQQDAWLCVLLGGILFLFSVIIALRLAMYFPDKTILEYTPILLGPILGQIVNVFYFLLLIALVSHPLRMITIAVKLYLFDLTPPQIIITSLLALAVYATQYGYAFFIRFQQFTFLLLYPLFLLTILLGLLTATPDPFLPILSEGIMPVLKGSLESWTAYSGPELLAGLLFPFVTQKNAGIKSGCISIGVLTLLYTLITIVVQGNLTAKGAEHMLFPTIIAFRDVEIPDTFIERLDGYFMLLWIMIYFNSLSNFLSAVCFSIRSFLKLESHRNISILLAPLFYYLVDLPPNLQTTMKIGGLINKALLIWGIGVLPLLLLLAWRKKGKQC